MEQNIITIIFTIIGIIIGFGGNYLLEKFKARNELKKSISNKRAEAYIALWKLCDKYVGQKNEQMKKLEGLNKWYMNGGGLYLSFKATDRFFSSLNLLKLPEELKTKKLDELNDHLSWLRTEMKYEVGSYTRKEAHKKLPSIRKTDE